MSETKPSKQKLPPKTEDKVVEVSLKQVIWGFSMLMAGTAVVGTTIIILRDYSKYKRQKAIIDSVVKLIEFVRLDKEGKIWK